MQAPACACPAMTAISRRISAWNGGHSYKLLCCTGLAISAACLSCAAGGSPRHSGRPVLGAAGSRAGSTGRRWVRAPGVARSLEYIAMLGTCTCRMLTCTCIARARLPAMSSLMPCYLCSQGHRLPFLTACYQRFVMNLRVLRSMPPNHAVARQMHAMHDACTGSARSDVPQSDFEASSLNRQPHLPLLVPPVPLLLLAATQAPPQGVASQLQTSTACRCCQPSSRRR